MNKISYLILVLIVFEVSSCSSYKINAKKVDKLDSIASFNITDFETFIFNICESYDEKVDPTERFVTCPINFFDISSDTSLKKVEELYVLKHKKSNMIIYMTSFSHKYIRKQKGFLNNPEVYKNKFYIRDTEFIYVGKLNPEKKTIDFIEQKNNEKMIWNLAESIETSNEINVEGITVKTVENTDNPNEVIKLNNVFSIPFDFKLSNYSLLNRKNKSRPITKIYFSKNQKGKMEVIFEVNDSFGGYRFPARRILYFTKNLSSI